MRGNTLILAEELCMEPSEIKFAREDAMKTLMDWLEKFKPEVASEPYTDKQWSMRRRCFVVSAMIEVVGIVNPITGERHDSDDNACQGIRSDQDQVPGDGEREAGRGSGEDTYYGA